ncbi:MAG: hypothetical protein M1551_08580 [Firmicutes bacterium]|nr:hypothetical protein [Bacillota bacterium]
MQKACKPHRLTAGKAAANDVCEGGQEGYYFFSVDVDLFRYVGGEKASEWDKSPVPLSRIQNKNTLSL